MSVDIRSSDRRRFMDEIQPKEKEITTGQHKMTLTDTDTEIPKLLETDKRQRREIANSNERRRMQCINAGFSNLRTLIPQLEGEKLSKAAILQHTTEYITNLEKEKRLMQQQLEHSMRLLNDMGAHGERAATAPASATSASDGFVACPPPPSKRKKRITESSDEGVGALSDESDEGGHVSERLRQENANLVQQLEAERRRCQALEDHNRMLEERLLSLLHPQHSRPVEEMGPVKLEHTPGMTVVHESMYNQEVVEAIGSMESMPTPPRENCAGSQHFLPLQPPRPMSPTPERGMAMDVTVREPAVTIATPAGIHHDSSPLLRASLSPSTKAEVYSYCADSAPGVSFQRVVGVENSPAAVSEGVVMREGETTVRTFQHRDHPRRRHRQQVKLEQQRAAKLEEEQRRREEEERRQQERVTFTAPPPSHPNMFRPTQNLENLVEAIRHIEGEAALCDTGRLYEEERMGYGKRHVSSEESSSMSDPDELKSESSGRDSPQRHHTYHPQHHVFGEHLRPNTAAVPSISSSFSSSSSSESESYSSRPVSITSMSSSLTDHHPATTSILHSPSSYLRPGVIVLKQ